MKFSLIGFICSLLANVFFIISIYFDKHVDVDAEKWQSRKETFIEVKHIVDSLIKESSIKWDSLNRLQQNSMLLNGRLDALTQISYTLKDSIQ